MRLNCKVIEDLLPLYLDEICSEESRKLVDEHLSECEACRKLVETVTEMQYKKVEQEEPSETEVVKRSFKKVRRRWIVRFAATFLLILVFGVMTYDEIRGGGIAFSNLDDIYRCVKYIRHIEKWEYEKAAEMVDFAYDDYKLVESVAHMTMKEYEAYMKERFVDKLKQYQELGMSIEFSGFDMMYRREDGTWTICLRVDEYYPDGTKQRIEPHFGGETLIAGAASYPDKGKYQDKTERDDYIDEILHLYSEDESTWYQDYEIAFELKEGEKAILYRNGGDSAEVEGLINVTYGTGTYFIEEPFYQEKFETSVPGKYAVLGYGDDGKLVHLTEEEIKVEIIKYVE